MITKPNKINFLPFKKISVFLVSILILTLFVNSFGVKTLAQTNQQPNNGGGLLTPPIPSMGGFSDTSAQTPTTPPPTQTPTQTTDTSTQTTTTPPTPAPSQTTTQPVPAQQPAPAMPAQTTTRPQPTKVPIPQDQTVRTGGVSVALVIMLFTMVFMFYYYKQHLDLKTDLKTAEGKITSQKSSSSSTRKRTKKVL